MATFTTPSVHELEPAQSPAGMGEPSMEDILASIRRIIAEDQTNGLGRSGLGGLARRTAAADALPPEAEAPPALRNTLGAFADPVAPAVEAAPEAAAPEHHPAVVDPEARDPHAGWGEPEAVAPPPSGSARAAESAHAVEPSPPPSRPAADAAAVAPADDLWHEEPLISPAAGASITSSFSALAESMVLQDTAMIERMTREALKPLLKSWLEDNLPSLVERLVRSEIERVARGGRGRD